MSSSTRSYSIIQENMELPVDLNALEETEYGQETSVWQLLSGLSP